MYKAVHDNNNLRKESVKENEVGILPDSEIDDYAEKPPLRIDSTLHLAWGLTLSLSHDNNQVSLGTLLNDHYVKNFADTFSNENFKDQRAKRYIENLGSLLGTYLRSMGYEKDIYDSYLDVQQTKRNQKINTINELSDMTSLSKEGLVAKVVSFFGIGSLPAAISWLYQSLSLGKSYQNISESISNMSAQIQSNASNVQNVTKTIVDLANAADKVKGTASPSTEIALMVFAGFIGVAVLTAIFRSIRDKRICKYIDEAYEKQQRYWESVARPSYVVSLVRLYEDIISLLRSEYPNYHEEIMESSCKLYEVIDDILPRTLLYARSRVICRWDRIPATEAEMFREYLKLKYEFYWIDGYDFRKVDNARIECSCQDKNAEQHTLSIVRERGYNTSRQEEKAMLMLDGKKIDEFRVMAKGGNPTLYEKAEVDL